MGIILSKKEIFDFFGKVNFDKSQWTVLEFI